MEVYYTSNNCTGTPYLATPSGNGGITIGSTQPLVVSAAPDRSQDAYVFDSVMYYPNTTATNGIFAASKSIRCSMTRHQMQVAQLFEALARR